jgi:hypothetical protein
MEAMNIAAGISAGVTASLPVSNETRRRRRVSTEGAAGTLSS